jgi:hypothetical protein
VASIEILLVAESDVGSRVLAETVTDGGLASPDSRESSHDDDCACLCACSCINAQSVVVPCQFAFGFVAAITFRQARVPETLVVLPRPRPEIRPPLS